VDGEDDGNGDYFCDLRLESMRAAIQAGCKLRADARVVASI